MAKSQENAYKTTMAVLLAAVIMAGSISAAAAACANALPAATTTYCSGLSAVVPAGAQSSPCNDDPGCGAVRQISTGAATCVPLDTYCCVQTDCYADSTGGSCKNGTTLACSSTNGGTPTLAPTTAPGVIIPSNTTIPSTPVASAPTTSPTGPGSIGGSNNFSAEALVNTTSNTVLVCYEIPIAAIVR